MNTRRLTVVTEILLIVAFLSVLSVVAQNSVFAVKNEFMTRVGNDYDSKAVFDRLDGLEDPERFLEELSSEIETIPYEKTAVVVDPRGTVAVMSSRDRFRNGGYKDEDGLQEYVDASKPAFRQISELQTPRWSRSSENNSSVRYAYYCIINGTPTALYVEFKLSPLKALFENDDVLFLLVEMTAIFIVIQIAAVIVFIAYRRKDDRLEKIRFYYMNGIAHEIKTPVAEIVNLTECASSASSQEEKDKFLELISDCGEKLRSTVDLFLKNSYCPDRQRLDKTEFSLSDAARRKAEEYLPLFEEKGIAAETDFSDPLFICADAQLIDIVIDNFLSNALKYTDPGCCVRIKTYRNGKRAGFSVYNQTDLPVDEKSIRSPTFGADGVTGRMRGVGLDLCRKISELHKFRYGCRREKGGAEFFFEADIKSYKKTVIMIVSVIAVTAIAAFTLYRYFTVRAYSDKLFPLPENYSELPVDSPDCVLRLFNDNDKQLMSGYCDHILVAHIDAIDGTVYRDVGYDGLKLRATPYTQYLIRNCSNIKGHFRMDTSIPVLDYGGISIDGKKMIQSAPQLRAGYYYVLYLRVCPSGIYLQKAYTLGSDTKTDINALLVGDQRDWAFRVYCECLEGYENEDLTYAPIERFDSEFEMDDKQITIEEEAKSGTTLVYYDPEVDTTAPIDYSVERTTEAP